jgi:membrane-associated phospholipid phosphatase
MNEMGAKFTMADAAAEARTGARQRPAQCYKRAMDTFLHDISWVVPLRSTILTYIFEAFTWLGYPQFFLVFLPIGYWLWDKKMFTRLAVLIGIVAISNSFLKDLFQDPRPPLEFALDGRVGESFGFPSGHAQIAVTLWLWLAYEIGRTWAWIGASIIAAGVCFSRLYLGVHDVEDILGGALLGLATIVIYRALLSDQFKAWHDLKPELQLLAIAALAPLFWLVWPADAVPVAIFGFVAFIFSWWLGRMIEERWISYERHENWIIAVAAAVAGVVILFSLDKALTTQLDAIGMSKVAATALRFTIVSLYVTAIAPAIFRLTRLAW